MEYTVHVQTMLNRPEYIASRMVAELTLREKKVQSEMSLGMLGALASIGFTAYAAYHGRVAAALLGIVPAAACAMLVYYPLRVLPKKITQRLEQRYDEQYAQAGGYPLELTFQENEILGFNSEPVFYTALQATITKNHILLSDGTQTIVIPQTSLSPGDYADVIEMLKIQYGDRLAYR